MLKHLFDKKLAVLLSAALLTTSSLFAQGGSHQIPLSSLTLNGTANYATNVIQLTNTTVEAGSAFIPTPYTLGANDEFEVMFTYHAFDSNGNPPADGLAFVAQNAAGPNYLGENGSGLGFFTLTVTPAIAATFDYYPNVYTGTLAGAASIATPNGVDIQTVYPKLGVLAPPASATFGSITITPPRSSPCITPIRRLSRRLRS
jgi:hypothetical protein